MRKGFASIIALSAMMVAMFSGTGANAAAAFTCPSSAPSLTLANGSVTPGTVNPNSSLTFKMTVSGGQGELVVNNVGDTDLIVCKAGTTTAVCSSTNAAGVPDACADEGLTAAQSIGPGLAPGTYWAKLIHCTDTSCGYDADVPAPLPVVITFAVV